jgi:hypothetical protein
MTTEPESKLQPMPPTTTDELSQVHKATQALDADFDLKSNLALAGIPHPCCDSVNC